MDRFSDEDLECIVSDTHDVDHIIDSYAGTTPDTLRVWARAIQQLHDSLGCRTHQYAESTKRNAELRASALNADEAYAIREALEGHAFTLERIYGRDAVHAEGQRLREKADELRRLAEKLRTP